MPDFLKETEQEYKTIKKLYKDMEASLHETIKWFAMDPRKVSTEDFFTYFVKFINNFEKARKENEYIRETKKKEEHKREVEEAAKKKRENMKRREEEELTHSDEHGNNKKGLLDDLLSKIEHGELGPKKAGLQKKGVIRVAKKSGPSRQLSSVDEDKLKESNLLSPSTSRFHNNVAPVLPPKTRQQQQQQQTPLNPVLPPSYKSNKPTPPSYNPPVAPSLTTNPQPAPSYSSNSSSVFSYNTNDVSLYSNTTSQNTPSYPPPTTHTSNMKKVNSFSNDYSSKVHSTYTQGQYKYPYTSQAPPQIPDPIPTPRDIRRAAPQPPAADSQTNHYPYQRPKPPVTGSRVVSQSPPPPSQTDDLNGHYSSMTDKIAVFNKVSGPRKAASRNQRKDDQTFF